jgi:phosphoribosyl 1,2-cyclic phosphodiesterase
MRISVLASGSAGNCFYTEHNNNAILIDAGISYKQICERLMQIGTNIQKVKGVFITHEHSDHIKAVKQLVKHKIPIYLSESTYINSRIEVDAEYLNFVNDGDEILLDDFLINAFAKNHDAVCPLSYSVNIGGKIASFITDVGCVCDNVRSVVSNSDFLLLETNHDIEMLKTGSYPYYLKKRILGDKGHLSNYHAGLLILESASKRLQHLYLGHLSEGNNTPQLAYDTVKNLICERKDLSNLHIELTYKDRPTKIIDLK